MCARAESPTIPIGKDNKYYATNHKYNFIAFTEVVSELCRCDSFQRFSPDTYNLEANGLYYLSRLLAILYIKPRNEWIKHTECNALQTHKA